MKSGTCFSKMLHLQVTCEIQTQRQEVYCACLDHTFVPISWMCNEETAVSQCSARSEIISLDASLRMEGLPALQIRKCVFGTLSSKPAKGNFERHKRERVTPSHSHSDNCVFESINHVPP